MNDTNASSLELAFRALEEQIDPPSTNADLIAKYTQYFATHAPAAGSATRGTFAIFSLVDPTIRIGAVANAFGNGE